MKRAILVLVIFLLGTIAVLAQESHDSGIEEGKKLVESKTSCDKISNEQLEAIGDYYMEQMHPGEAHEIMDNMMGGEGSKSLKQVHISMARRLYCNDKVYIGYGMMGSGGMMNMMGGGNMMGYSGGMMGYGSSGWGWWSIFSIINYLLIVALIIAAIYWLIRNADRKR